MKSIRIVFLNLAIFLILICLIEAGFRFFSVPYNPKRQAAETRMAQFDPDSGWSYIPGYQAVFSRGENEAPLAYVFNRDGIRVPRPDYEFEYSKPAVLFIGGSFTMGHGVNYGSTLPGLVASFPGMPYQVVNLGVQAYGTDQAVISLERHISKFKTKYVVYTFIPEHISRNIFSDRRLLQPDLKFLGTKPLFMLDNDGRVIEKQKPQLYKDYKNSYFLDWIRIHHPWVDKRRYEKGVGLTRGLILRMKEAAQRQNANFLVIRWRRQNSKQFLKDLEDKVFENLDVDVIDLADGLPADWGSFKLEGDGHPDERAYQYAAKLVISYMLKTSAIQGTR